MKIRVKLDEVLKAKGMTQKELSELTKIRPASISDLSNNVRTAINRDHLCAVAEALKITDIRDLVDFE
ncbi:transcriptional regulator [Paenibacillus sp. VTT E-133280]|jgi:transcriptional regulator with XRE-family HTH domain|uniref:Transcriptional regulator n=1 Tax=Paenibacillus odorifer TaxID=189426 RepID=A0ABX3GNE1_9BACL|nr:MULTISPECIES: helix-turn-helix transcriptional regulator [Paenibacillus]OMC72986.1 transcriptional regulator [Paenibacillus odorifer]OMD29935.1 transcriptional regulator [Paenibacillus odorifer]OME16442.1 transcriptional regulator [Paenibacillus odorifer]OME55151.1 transcriptional regulator [Paenibacillus odorifer]OZQ66098.1 transcriptional regulator [Paenibacillus sp. VTT E-133280]